MPHNFPWQKHSEKKRLKWLLIPHCVLEWYYIRQWILRGQVELIYGNYLFYSLWVLHTKKVHSVSSNHDLDRDWRRPWCIKISVIHKKIGWHSIWESKLTHTVCNVLFLKSFIKRFELITKRQRRKKHLTSEQFYIYFLAHIYVLVICIHTFLAVCNGHVCNEGHCS